MKHSELAVSIGVALCFCLSASAQTRPAATEPSSIAIAVTASADGAYTGGERCRSCHKAEFQEFGKTKHAGLPPAHANAVTGCEMCHGAGKAHADAEEAAHGDDAKTVGRQETDLRVPRQSQAEFRALPAMPPEQPGSEGLWPLDHMQHGVACNDCHSTHLVDAARNPNGRQLRTAQADFFSVPKLPEENRWLHNSLLKKQQPELCFGCHGNIQAQFALPTHHRVPEGAMKCTDCHNTHGTSNRATLRQSGWETCTQCHVEKRGPFVFEHSAVKVEGCTACHTPHGSVNRMLLVRREERFLCLQCHVDPFARQRAAQPPELPDARRLHALPREHSRLELRRRTSCTEERA